MTEPDERPLSPAEQEVQRLLASARHTDPVPPEVAARLDGVLAGLAAGEHDEPAPTAAPAPVTDLDAHRRRRRVAQLLVAAAAVVVVGVGLNQVIEGGTGDEASSADSAGSTVPDGALDRDQPEAAEPQEQGNAAGSGAEQDGILNDLQGEAATVDPDAFDRDVTALRSQSYAASDSTRSQLEKSRLTAAAVACRSSAWGSGTYVPVSYGGAPGVVVLRRPQGDTQVADLFLCGDTEPVRSITLPAP